MIDLIQAFLKARQVSTPLLGISTPDPSNLIAKLANGIKSYEKEAIFRWDSMRGLAGITLPAKKVLLQLLGDGEEPNAEGEIITPEATKDINIALRYCGKLPEDSIVFLFNAHRWLSDATTCQAIWNLREPYKLSGSTLVLLAPTFSLPVELEQDIMLLDDPLPDDEFYESLLIKQFEAVRESSLEVDLPDPDGETKRRAIEALRGLAPFPAEEAIANSMSKDGIDIARLWERKCRIVEQTKGLQIRIEGETFDDIGGLDNFKSYVKRLFPEDPDIPITAIVFIDEIEKFLAGATGEMGDNTGVSQDFLGVLLREMEDNDWTGTIAVGPAGCSKSLAAKAVGHTFGVPTIIVDLGAMKGGIVGESEGNIRQAMKVIKAIGGNGCFFIATSNDISEIPASLNRRFRYGVWYFDLPTPEERDKIWEIHLAGYGLDPNQEKPDDTDWTGAEIRNCCELAKRMKISIAEAGLDIRPIAKQKRYEIERLRQMAHENWNSASYRGCYRLPDSRGDEIARMYNALPE